MSEYVGEAIAKIRIRKRSLMYVGPAQKTMSIDIREYASLFGSTNIGEDNVLVHKSVGAVTVKPLIVNRSNYIVESAKPNKNYIVGVPKGAHPETENEINKRVFESYPNEFQIYTSNYNVLFKRGDFVANNTFSPKGDKSDSPIFKDHLTNLTPDSNDPGVNWIYQEKASGNVEWFLMQKYGNFTNEPFWIELSKMAKLEPSGEAGTNEYARYTVYSGDKEIHAYFAIRIGWTNSDDIKNMNSSGLLKVRNTAGSKIGPYDIVFPIDGKPFIYDHQGKGEYENKDKGNKTKIGSYRYSDGFIASEAPNDSWIVSDARTNFRLYFWVLRGKLIITSSFASSAWVFPANINSKISADTKNRYKNFCIPPGKVCFFGRGFAWRMSFNPMEFNIYKDGVNRFASDGYHGKIHFLPIVERVDFPDGLKGGWRDYTQKNSNKSINSGKNGNHDFTIIPNDNYRNINNKGDNQSLKYQYGWDVITEPYYGLSTSSIGSSTSMMIPINSSEITKKHKKSGGNNPRSLVNAYFDIPSSASDISPTDNISESFGFQTTIKGMNAVFLYKIPTVELRCMAPSFGHANKSSFTSGISERFASPVFWAMRADHYTPPPPKPNWTDITKTIKEISYDMTCNDFQSFDQNFNVQIIVPKDYQYGDFGLGDNQDSYTDSENRNKFINQFYSGVLEIEIWLGWLKSNETQEPSLQSGNFGVFSKGSISDVEINGHEGRMVRVFTGLAYAGPLQQKYDVDIISLECKDFLSVLENQIILNSPIFDGMSTDNAFYSIGVLGGLPRELFAVRSASAWREILPMAFTFQNPKIKFNKNTNILSAIKQIAQYFMHVIRSDPDGRIVLGDVYYSPADIERGVYLGNGKNLRDLPLTHFSYDFYVDGGQGWQGQGGPPNPWQRCYESFSFDKSIKDQLTQLLVLTVDRDDGSLIMDNRSLDLQAIENPESKNFIGYAKMGRYQEPALGDDKHLKMFKKTFAKRFFTAPMKISFTTYGRPTLRPLDIIGVYHTHDLNLPEDVMPKGNTNNYLKYRVMSVKGSIKWEDARYQYKIDVEAEHI